VKWATSLSKISSTFWVAYGLTGKPPPLPPPPPHDMTYTFFRTYKSFKKMIFGPMKSIVFRNGLITHDLIPCMLCRKTYYGQDNTEYIVQFDA
jgi:hypothetical protein